jgi:hypothetical protein
MEPIYVYNLSREDKINTVLKEIGSVNIDRDKKLLVPIIDHIVGIAKAPQFDIDGKSYFISTAINPIPDPNDDRQDIILYKINDNGYFRLSFVNLKGKMRMDKINKLI